MGGFIMFEKLEWIAKSISYHIKFELFKTLCKNKCYAIIMCVNGCIYKIDEFNEGMKILYPIDMDSDDALYLHLQRNLDESIAFYTSKLLPKALPRRSLAAKVLIILLSSSMYFKEVFIMTNNFNHEQFFINYIPEYLIKDFETVEEMAKQLAKFLEDQDYEKYVSILMFNINYDKFASPDERGKFIQTCTHYYFNENNLI